MGSLLKNQQYFPVVLSKSIGASSVTTFSAQLSLLSFETILCKRGSELNIMSFNCINHRNSVRKSNRYH